MGSLALWQMAEQGLFKFERVFDGHLLFYRVKDRYFVRRKSQLTAERVKTSKEFTKTMDSAHRLKTASRLAASVYRELPEAWKMYDLYRKLTGLATRLQKEGKTVNEIRPLLEKQLYDWGYRKEIDYPTIKPSQKPIVIRSTKECKAAQPTEQEKREKQPPAQSITRRLRKVKGKYNIRRNRKPAISRIPACNKSYQTIGLSGSLHLENALRTAPP